MLNSQQLKFVFSKTKGHCHFCGDRLELRRYGKRSVKSLNGMWELDHVIQRGKGGKDEIDNFLPTCARCNQLRWHRKGKQLRELIFLGLIVKAEIKKRSPVGKQILLLQKKRIESN